MQNWKAIICIASAISLGACSSVQSLSSSTPTESSSQFSENKPSVGGDEILSSLGMALLVGTIFATAPEAAYR